MASFTKVVLLVVISIAVAIYLDLIPSVEAYRHPIFGFDMGARAQKRMKKKKLKPTGSTGEKCDNGRNCLICEECPLCKDRHHPKTPKKKSMRSKSNIPRQYWSGCHKCALWFMTPPGRMYDLSI